MARLFRHQRSYKYAGISILWVKYRRQLARAVADINSHLILEILKHQMFKMHIHAKYIDNLSMENTLSNRDRFDQRIHSLTENSFY